MLDKSPASENTATRLTSTPGRLWRPAAQRSVRNAFSDLWGAQGKWEGAHSKGLSAATAVVNAFLSAESMDSMELGALKDMKEIRKLAKEKLHRQQERFAQQVLEAYQDMEAALATMQSATSSMRVYMSGYDPQGRGTFIQASPQKPTTPVGESDDDGLGGGMPVYNCLPLRAFEALAEEAVVMYERELIIKWLLTTAFHQLTFTKDTVDPPYLYQIQRPLGDGLAETDRQAVTQSQNVSEQVGTSSKTRQEDMSSLTVDVTRADRSTLQVYLAAWVSQVELDKQRLDEIKKMVDEEMTSS